MPFSLAIAGRAEPWFDDQLLADQLRLQSVTVDLIDWKSLDFDAGRYDGIYVSSTWDLRMNPGGFMNWLELCEADGCKRLINDRRVLREGIVKSVYLSAMAEHFGEDDKPSGSITPSRFFGAAGDSEDHSDVLDAPSFSEVVDELEKAEGWCGRDLVIKPIVSADGHNTYTVARSGYLSGVRREHVVEMGKANEAFADILEAPGGYGAIVQQYQKGIEAGEVSLVFLGGLFSHGIQKPPGFRSSDTSKRRALSPKEIPTAMMAFSEAIIEWATQRYGVGAVTRARIDLIEGKHGPVLCELECVEPNTNLRSFGESARASILSVYADVLMSKLETLASA